MNPVIVTVIVLTVAMIVGPLAMMRPTLGQKRREALRRYANGLGLGVAMRRRPSRATDTDGALSLPVYTAALKGGGQWMLSRTAYAHEANLNGWWEFVGPRPAPAVQVRLERHLALLPEGVEAIESRERELGVYWREREGEAGLDKIAEFMRALGAAGLKGG